MIRVNGDTIDWFEGMTVKDMFGKMGFDSPLITVIVNDTFVLEDDYDDYQIPDNAEVKAIHLHHGG